MILRLGLCMAILLFMLFSPPVLIEALDEDFYSGVIQIKKPEWRGSITLYHIVTHKTYQGSVTYYLQTQAEEFEKANRGVFIEVVGMSEQDYLERLEYGRRPDAYSFFAGTVYAEQLRELSQSYEGFIPGLKAYALAAPYFFSGYADCINEQGADGGAVSASCFMGALLELQSVDDAPGFMDGRYGRAILNLRELGDCKRNEKPMQMKVGAAGGFTEQVCYLGIAKETSDDKAYWMEQFFLWLLEEKAQQQLTGLGAFSVREGLEQVFSDGTLSEIRAAYASVETVDPFLYYSHKAAMLEDAGLAVAGDAAAQGRFNERLSVVLS
ncbi:MAG: hypothetical protein Q4C04_06315 [Clostridia bacterium]|nr:hypothetical protein [Clostridia bacterium]